MPVKKAKKSSIPSYCLHRPSGQAYVRIHGKVVYCGEYGTAKSKAEYGRLIAELAASPNATPPKPSEVGLTVVEIADAYWTYISGYYTRNGKPTSTVQAIRRSLRPVRALYGSTPAVEFGPVALKAVRHAMLDSGKSNRSTINKWIGCIVRMFKWAGSEELVPSSVWQAMKTVEGLKMGRTEAREPGQVFPVADDLVDATLPFLPAIVGVMVRFQRLTGARPGEVCQLRPCDVNRSGKVWEYQPVDHKTAYRGRKRIIYIGPKTQTILLLYLARDPQATCFSPAESERERHIEQRKQRRTRVQPSQQHRRKKRPQRMPQAAYTKDSYQRAISRAIVKANKARTEEAKEMGLEKPVFATPLARKSASSFQGNGSTSVRSGSGSGLVGPRQGRYYANVCRAQRPAWCGCCSQPARVWNDADRVRYSSLRRALQGLCVADGAVQILDYLTHKTGAGPVILSTEELAAALNPGQVDVGAAHKADEVATMLLDTLRFHVARLKLAPLGWAPRFLCQSAAITDVEIPRRSDLSNSCFSSVQRSRSRVF